MATAISAFFALAAVGFTATLTVHVASWFGNTYLFDRAIGVLGIGVFVVFIPTVFVVNRTTRDFKRKDLWRAALRGCPRWMYWTFWAIFAYGWAGAFVFPLLHGGDSGANSARTMSAILLVFYVVSLAVMYSAMHVERFDESRRCLNGHRVSPLAKFCEECGAPVATSSTSPPVANA